MASFLRRTDHSNPHPAPTAALVLVALAAGALGLLSRSLTAQTPVPLLGGDILVNAYTTYLQAKPAVSIDDAGNFVVVWASTNQDGSYQGIFGQLFDPSGARVGGEFPVNTYTTGVQREPRVARHPDGNFLVVWEST